MARRSNVPILTRASRRVKNNATNGLVQSRRFQAVLSKHPVRLRDAHAKSFGTIPYNLCLTRARSKARSNILYLVRRSKTVLPFSGHAQSLPAPYQYVGYVRVPNC